jgi:hypothetical protein
MLRGWELEPVVHDRVIRERVESIIRSLDGVKEESAILMLQDRLELLLGRLLLETFEGEILFTRDMDSVLPLMNPVDLTVSTLAPAPTSALASVADTTTL